MKIAYIITAYNNPEHLNRLITALNTPDVFFFINIDRRSTYKFNLPNIKNLVSIKKYDVYWGSFSFVEALFDLINKSFDYGTFDYYVLLSGSDYPVKSNAYIHTFLSTHKNKEFINLCKMPEKGKGFDRVDYYYIPNDNSLSFSTLLKRIVNRLVRLINIKRRIPSSLKHDRLYGGSTWWALSDACIRYIDFFMKEHPDVVHFYKNTRIPEEMFVHTIIGNSNYIKNVVPSFTYAHWNDPHAAHPMELDMTMFSLLRAEHIETDYGKAALLFARKFTKKSNELINELDKSYGRK